MKRQVFLIIILNSLLVFFLSGQSSFKEDERIYFFRDANNTQLSYMYDYANNPNPSIKNMCTLPAHNKNCLGANPIDYYMYYINWESATGCNVYRLDTNCTTTYICSFSYVLDPKAGCFDEQGVFWVIGLDPSVTSQIIMYGIEGFANGNCTIKYGPIVLPSNVTGIGKYTDLVYSKKDKIFYAITQFSKFYLIDTTGVVLDEISDEVYFSPNGNYGGLEIGTDGIFYALDAVGVDGVISGIDMTTKSVTITKNFSPGPPNGNEDFASFAQYLITEDTVQMGNDSDSVAAFSFFIPNTFSPNGDVINDQFKIRATNINKFNITIYDLQGKKVYVSDNMNEAWDGTVDGRIASAGTYVYNIELLSGETGKIITQRGNITLIK